MRRFALLATLAVGCGGNNNMMNTDGPSSDGGSAQDLTMPGAKDMSGGGGGQTGDPCKAAADCAGTTPVCVTMTMGGTMWPGGYCSSKCNPSKNDQNTGLNASCPGSGTCLGMGSTGQCEAACMGGDCRMGYSCFFFGDAPSCEPSSISECDPTKKNCHQDGGTKDDAGTYFGFVCDQVGPDPVGFCDPACNVFEQNCDAANMLACFADTMTGLQSCVSTSGTPEGMPCNFLNDCAGGLACHDEGNNMAFCRKYCGGPGNVGCPQGQTCKDLSAMVMKSVVGICGP